MSNCLWGVNGEQRRWREGRDTRTTTTGNDNNDDDDDGDPHAMAQETGPHDVYRRVGPRYFFMSFVLTFFSLTNVLI